MMMISYFTKCCVALQDSYYILRLLLWPCWNFRIFRSYSSIYAQLFKSYNNINNKRWTSV